MTDFDERIRRGMHDRAAAVAPTADLDDLVERIASDRSRRRRVSAAVLTLVVVAGPIAGFTVARASERSPASAASRRSQAASKVRAAAPRFDPSPLPALKPQPTRRSTFALSTDSAVSALQDQKVAIGPSEPLSLGRMFARVSGDGTDLRVYGARLPARTVAVPWFTPAAWCFPDRLVQVDTSNTLVTGISQSYLMPQPRGDLTASVQFVGVSEGAPLWIAIVQGDKGVTARATFADGGVDTARLDDGVAVLSHRTTTADATASASQKLHVELLDAGGAVVAETVVDASGSGSFDKLDSSSSPACLAPATLPAAGAEQPADVASATAAVTQAFADVYAEGTSRAARDAVIDDLAGVDAAYAQLYNGSFAAEAKAAVAHVTGVVFLSATKAAVAYDIDIAGYSNFTGRFGEAVFTGGRWKVTRDTICNDLSLAMVTCPG